MKVYIMSLLSSYDWFSVPGVLVMVVLEELNNIYVSFQLFRRIQEWFKLVSPVMCLLFSAGVT